MTSWDYFVGFGIEPRRLDEFLDSQGYILSKNQPGQSENGPEKNYESKERLVDLFYFSKSSAVKEGEVPDWRSSGFEVTSELMISTKDESATEEALRLAKAIVREYNGFLYDPTLDEYFRSKEL